MIITLFLNNKLINFRLPSSISGSFSFDENSVDKKLINIEARNGAWVLYSTSDSKIVDGNVFVKEKPLVNNTFYILSRNNINYLIYVTDILKNKMIPFAYQDKFALSIGKDANNSVMYDCPYLNDFKVVISVSNGQIKVTRTGNGIYYVNNYAMNQDALIKNGDEIQIYGLRILILNGMVFINDIPDKLRISSTDELKPYVYAESEEKLEINIVDQDLYSPDEYYSKYPGLRRMIGDKKIKLTTPPRNETPEEMPLILTMGPMMTMGVMSMSSLITTFSKVQNNEATWGSSWPTIVTCIAMLASMIFWPTITRSYNKKRNAKKRKEIADKYDKYLAEKRNDLEEEAKQEKVILTENLITVDDCIEILNRKKINFWNKRSDQNDFLVTRIGIGNTKLKATLDYSEEDFTIEENELRKKADQLSEEYKYIKNVPVSYSLYENKMTAVMGQRLKSINFMYNLLLQLMTFYSYEDLKICLFANENTCKDWEFLRYLNHTFNNERTFRFFATNQQSIKEVVGYLNNVVANRVNNPNKSNTYTPHYLIIVDGCDKIKNYDFVKTISEADDSLGFSMILVENQLSKLPSKCNDFISLGDPKSELLINSYEDQEKIEFTDEVKYNLPMLDITKRFANIPIEFNENIHQLPNSISFLEMEDVGKVEQLNILNRWHANDPTQSLRAEIGVDDEGDLMYLDLHEKYQGPHGLIAGMTGSGKSEFIITYILSMCVNYSPEDVSFVLIDYKGGGLAFAFENVTANIVLPHLAGTITNLDKAEMDRTLVSINSEIERRQEKFNEARDILGESTIDIYKYQRYYKEGKLEEPISHLFIICDEFAELKSQQPDFMDNLISIARIGRSLGIHLILSTQKPSGVVNDQIWSNSRFRVCLKVQDEADSREMLKRTEAASIKQAGRFYLQVGYDEYFGLGQSAWCGAKYYPSDSIVKQVDKSVNFIDDCGNLIKSVEAKKNVVLESKGEQITSILNTIIEVSKLTNQKTKRLWLENIPGTILVDVIDQKYDLKHIPYNVEAIIGEYDAPEIQKQGVVKYNFLNDGNTIIYSNDGLEREMILNSIIYSTIKYYSPEEINYYIVDYGTESLRNFKKFPHIGGMVFASDEDKFNNLIKYITNEIKTRKKLFADYNGNYRTYINSGKKIPLKVVIMNNFDSINENNNNIYDYLPDLVRDSESYGIVFIFTVNTTNSIMNKVSQSCPNAYALTLKDKTDYSSLFNTRVKQTPRSILGRGLCRVDGIHEFQTASIVPNIDDLNEFLTDLAHTGKYNVQEEYTVDKIPSLPDKVTYDLISKYNTNIENVVLGISRDELNVTTLDLTNDVGVFISSLRINNTMDFVKSMLFNLKSINGLNTIILDPTGDLKLDKAMYPNYYTQDFEGVCDMVTKFIRNKIDTNDTKNGVILVYGITKLLNNLSKNNNVNKFNELLKVLKTYEKYNVIIVDSATNIKQYSYEEWYKLFNTNNGIWIGKGIVEQTLFHISHVNREMQKDISNDMGYVLSDGSATLCKLIDYEER